MSNQLLASKIVVAEEEPSVRNIASAATAVLGIVGVTERGPHAATLVQSVSEYDRLYGGYVAAGQAKQALDGFFANGGSIAYVKRAVHYTDLAVPASRESVASTLTLLTAAGAAFAAVLQGTAVPTYVLSPGDTIIADIDGVGDQTATFDATAATVTGSNSETFALSDGQTLIFSVDGGGAQTATFNTAEFSAIGAATAAEVAAVINAEITGVQSTVSGGPAVIITSDKKGTDSQIGALSGTAAAALGFAGGNTGTGDVADIGAVTFAEVEAILEADLTNGGGVVVTQDGNNFIVVTSGTVGASASIAVNATSTADALLGLDNATHSGGSGAAVNTLKIDGKTEGAYGNSISVIIAAATSGDSDEFNLSVSVSGVIVEVFPNLSMTDGDANFVESVINDVSTGSNLIAVVDLDAAPPSPADLPAPGTLGPMTGGNDGISSLVAADFVGNEAGETGIRGLDLVQGLTLLAIPDSPTSAVQNAMITYCETTRDKEMLAILDPPAGNDATGINTYVVTTAALLNLSEFGAMFWPQVKVLNPNAAVFGTNGSDGLGNIVVPASGHIAGVMSRTDSARPGGIYDPPAGVERGILAGITGFETDEVLKESKRDLVYPKRINPLTTIPGFPRYIDGVRTLKGNGNFPTIAERRGVIFIEQSIKAGLQFARNSNNTEELRATVDRTITAFLLIQMKQGAFRTKNPATAFFVDVGEGLNPPSVIFAGKLIVRIGLATNKPAEFIILRFSQDTRALTEELAV